MTSKVLFAHWRTVVRTFLCGSRLERELAGIALRDAWSKAPALSRLRFVARLVRGYW